VVKTIRNLKYAQKLNIATKILKFPGNSNMDSLKCIANAVRYKNCFIKKYVVGS